MANITINGLPTIGTIANGDEIPVWDVSGNLTGKVTRLALIGGTITGGGTIATVGNTLTVAGTSSINGTLSGGGTVDTGGYTLTVPATGTAALRDAANVFTQNQAMDAQLTVAAIRSRVETIAQDAVVSFIPFSNLGLALISPNFFPDVAGIVTYRAAASGFCSLLVGGGNLEVATGVLTGTTGNNGKITVSIVGNGGMYIENRRTSSIQLKITFIG